MASSISILLCIYFFFFFFSLSIPASQALGSMSSAAASYGGNGPAFCELQTSSDGGDADVQCFGSDAASVYGAPLRLALAGVTAGDGFFCGLVLATQLPYCWGNNVYVQQGTPMSKGANITYKEICAGDNHLCALRREQEEAAVDCWGYNMTGTFMKEGGIVDSITAGSSFSCGLWQKNRTVICWGDETGSGVISKAPKQVSFKNISAGGYHVCGIVQENGATLCWGRPLEQKLGFPGSSVFSSLVGGKFHACGLLASQSTPACWGLIDPPNSTPPPSASRFSVIVAGDYYTCGLPSSSLHPLCWGSQFPVNLPTSALPTSLNCSLCSSLSVDTDNCPPDCSSSSSSSSSPPQQLLRRPRPRSIQTPIIIGELSVAIVVAGCVLAAAIFVVRYKVAKLAAAAASGGGGDSSSTVIIKKSCAGGGIRKGSFGGGGNSFQKDKFRAEMEEPKMTRAEVFSYQELEEATGGFGKENEVGKGSFACVFRGELSDGRVVAVKRPTNMQSQSKDSSEFHNELDLLSRLNHAHLLNLLGFCDDGERGERLLVYEFMANGTLHEQLHGNKKKAQLGWIRRVTIAVQAARGLEYLHGYACPPVIHRDIKSSNILLDKEWNARVSDFGLSLLGPSDSQSPLSEPPAGTLGYLDPEYYRLHYLTTKSDVYSFGVLLLEILSGRKAIDMQFDEGNIVEWSVPLIKDGKVALILDPRLDTPPDLDAIQKIARVAARCVKMRGKDRPSMDKVTTSLERALAMLMGTYSDAQPFLPSEVVLGSNRLHRKSSRSSCRSTFNADSSDTTTDDHGEHKHSSFATYPSIYSSRRGCSLSDNDVGATVDMSSQDLEQQQQPQQQLLAYNHRLQSGPGVFISSPREQLFLHSNF